MGLYRLINDLIKVDCDEEVVPLARGHHLVQHLFALEHDSATHSWANIHDLIITHDIVFVV